MNPLTMFWSETAGVWSSKRVISFIISVLFSLVVSISWLYCSFKSGTLVEIPDSVILLLSSILGLTFSFQVGGTAVDKLKKD